MKKKEKKTKGIPRGLRLNPDDLSPASVRIWMARIANAMLRGDVSESMAGKCGYIAGGLLRSLDSKGMAGTNGFTPINVVWSAPPVPGREPEGITVLTATPLPDRGDE